MSSSPAVAVELPAKLKSLGEDQILAEILRLRSVGYPLYAIARNLGCMPKTVSAILKRNGHRDNIGKKRGPNQKSFEKREFSNQELERVTNLPHSCITAGWVRYLDGWQRIE